MITATTIREFYDQHPELRDVPMAVATSDGRLDYLSGAGMCYEFIDTDEEGTEFAEDQQKTGLKVLVFSCN